MKRYRIENNEVLLEFLDYGGILTKMVNKKTKQNYVLNYQNQADYLQNPYYFGAIIGRNAGRTFPPFYINYQGEKVVLDQNEGEIHLHGGKNGLHKINWQVQRLQDTAYRLFYEDVSSNYEPMHLELIYELKQNCFQITMTGKGEIPRICNLTNHSYFNLGNEGTIEEHTLQIAPATLQLIDKQLIPTEEYSLFEATELAPFDFSYEKIVRAALNCGTELAHICSEGIDLAYCFKECSSSKPKIILTDRQEKNRLTIYSDQEACVVYTLNKLSDEVKLDQGYSVRKYSGITFEMQRRPNYVQTTPDYLTRTYSAFTCYKIE